MNNIKKASLLLLIMGFLFGGCTAPAEPVQPAVQETPVSSCNWRDALPAPPYELMPTYSGKSSNQDESITKFYRVRTITLPDGTNLSLTFNGFVHVVSAPSEEILYSLQNVEVREGDTLIQTITFDAPYFQSEGGQLWCSRAGFGVTIADMNFDKALDWSIENNLAFDNGASFQFSFHFLWDDVHRCFIPFPALDVLDNPQFDFATQIITSAYSCNPHPLEAAFAYEDQYRYMNGGLQCIGKSEIILDRKQWALTTRTAEWDGAVLADLPPKTEPAYREITRVAELKTGCWVKLTAWGVRLGALPNENDYRSGWLKRIDVYSDNPETTSTPPVQTILREPPYINIWLEDSTYFGVDFTDYNFDGHPDLHYRCGDTICARLYTFHLWEPHSGRFVENKMLGAYTGELTANTEAKEVDFVGRPGCYLGWVKTSLRWQGDGLIPVRQSLYEYLPDMKNSTNKAELVRHTMSVYRNGKWILVSEEIIPLSQFDF